MKSPSPPPSPVIEERITLLTEAVRVLIAELSAASDHSAWNLPEIKKKKVVLASRLAQIDWSSGPLEAESFDLASLKSLVTDLETDSRQKIQSHLEFIGNQLLILQDEHQFWLECLNVSFRRFCAPTPSQAA